MCLNRSYRKSINISVQLLLIVTRVRHVIDFLLCLTGQFLTFYRLLHTSIRTSYRFGVGMDIF